MQILTKYFIKQKDVKKKIIPVFRWFLKLYVFLRGIRCFKSINADLSSGMWVYNIR